MEVRHGGLLVAEDLDNLLAVQHLLDEAVHQAQVFLLLDVVLSRQPGQRRGHQQHDDGGENGDHGQQRVQHQHGDEGGDHGDAGVDDLGDALTHQLAQGVHVVGVDGHDVAVGVGVEVLDGQGLHFPEEVLAQVQHGALADGDHQAVVGVGRQDAHRHQAGQADQGGGQAAEISAAAGEHGHHVVVHQGLGEGGGDHSGRGGEQDAAHHQGKGQLVVAEHIPRDPVQHGAGPPAGNRFVHNDSSFQAGWSKSPPPLTWESWISR